MGACMSIKQKEQNTICINKTQNLSVFKSQKQIDNDFTNQELINPSS